MANRYDYYYGNEAEQFRYYQIPKELLDNSDFSTLSLDAKLLYAVLRDRMQLSRANNWIDADKRIYIIFSVEAIAQKIGVSVDKAVRLLKELEKFGLVEKKRRGQGMTSLLYIMNFASGQSELENEPDLLAVEPQNPSQSPVVALNSENQNSRILKIRIQESAKSEFKNPQNQNSRIRKTGILESAKSESNDLKENNPEWSDTEGKEPEGSEHSFDRSFSLSYEPDQPRDERPSVVLGVQERLTPKEEETMGEILEANDGVPWSMIERPEIMKKMMMYIGCWKGIYTGRGAGEREAVHRVAVECLAEMAMEREPWSCKGSMITYKQVIERVNCTLQEEGGKLLYEMMERVVEKYLDASLNNYIQNPKLYIKAIIWEQLYASHLESDSYYRKRVHDDFG